MNLQDRNVDKLNFTIPEEIALCFFIFHGKISKNLDYPGIAGIPGRSLISLYPYVLYKDKSLFTIKTVFRNFKKFASDIVNRLIGNRLIVTNP